MKPFKIKIDEEALTDIQEAAKWYNEQVSGLGSRFKKQVKKQIDSLKATPNSYGKRYADVRCMLINKFPFLVHFKINDAENTVEVFAILHTSRNPKIWEERKKKN